MAGASSVGDTFAKGIARNTASAHACKEIEQIGKICKTLKQLSLFSTSFFMIITIMLPL